MEGEGAGRTLAARKLCLYPLPRCGLRHRGSSPGAGPSFAEPVSGAVRVDSVLPCLKEGAALDVLASGGAFRETVPFRLDDERRLVQSVDVLYPVSPEPAYACGTARTPCGGVEAMSWRSSIPGEAESHPGKPLRCHLEGDGAPCAGPRGAARRSGGRPAISFRGGALSRPGQA